MQPWMTVPLDWRRPEQQKSYNLYWCAASGYGKVYPSPSTAEIPGFYDIPYYTHTSAATPSQNDTPHLAQDDVAESRDGAPWLARFGLNKLRQHLGWRFDQGTPKDEAWWQALLGAPPAKVCELGCGNGWILSTLNAIGYQVTGVEPDNIARQTGQAQGLNILEGTAERLPVELVGQTFDLVLANHVLEHCLDPLAALQNAHKLLKPEGILVLETPNSDCWGSHQAGIAWPFLDVPRHLHFFTAQSLQAMAEKVNFCLQRIEYEGYYIQVEQPWLKIEAEIWRQFGRPEYSYSQLINSAWQLLVRTALARPAQKYASVRVVMRKNATS
jgi:2-polyprenyl-3-methyl-5-hydroxy-6-metoxy-1,4-benzoquinol methylase